MKRIPMPRLLTCLSLAFVVSLLAASMTSDLRAVTEEQEAFYFDHRFYSITTDSLNPNYTAGNTITIHEATASGWSGSVANPKVTKQCYVVVGNAAPVGTATNDGAISCS